MFSYSTHVEACHRAMERQRLANRRLWVACGFMLLGLLIGWGLALVLVLRCVGGCV